MITIHRLFKQIRKLLAHCLEKLQKLFFYRRVVRLLRYGIKIKEADEEDMKSFYQWFNPKRPTEISHNPNVTNFVAQKKDTVIGFVQLVRIPENKNLYAGHWLFSLTVKTLYRGMGIGEDLAKAVIEKAKTYGAKELSLLVREDNERAINLNKKLGFRRNISLELEEKLKQEAIKTGRRRIIMSKDLS